MLLVRDAIAYLEDTSIKTSERFKVLTGFDTEVNNKDRNPAYWFNALYDSKIIETLEKTKATSGFGSFFSSVASVISGTNLESQLKAAYKKGSTSSDEQQEGQEEYLGIVIAFLKENQMAESLATFQFNTPETLVNRQVEPLRSNSYS